MVKGLIRQLRDSIGAWFSLPGDFLGVGLGMPPAEAGVMVTEMTAMQVGAVAACIRIISTAVSTLPNGVYERLDDGGFKLSPDHYLYGFLNSQPSPEYTAVDFYCAAQVHLLQAGNAFIEILRDGGDRPREMQLRSPFRTVCKRNIETGELVYETTDTPTGRLREIEARNMIHVKGLGVDPYTGLSPIKFYAREVIGTALASQAYGARFFKNDARPGGYLKTDKILKQEDKAKGVQSWIAGHSAGNSHQVALLDGGMSWEKVGINPDEAQFLETQKADAIKIGYIFGVPAYMLGGEQESRATIEQKALEFLIWTIKPWLRRWEQALNSKLFPTTGRNANKYFCKFDTSEYERADFATLLKGLQVGRYAGLMTANEGRKALGLNPLTSANFNPEDPGNLVLQPVNMAIVTEDGTISPASGNGAEGQTEDQGSSGEATDGDVRALFRQHWPDFQAAIIGLREANNPDLGAFQMRLWPVLNLVTNGDGAGQAEATRLIRAMHANWPKWAMRGSAEETFRKAIRAIVRAAKAHRKGEQCE